MPWLIRQRRRIATLLLVAFAAAATGVPLPVPRIAMNPAERYPCENCGCGCNSASVCWTNCCCHTMAERLAWARQEGVRPPQEALQAALAQGLDVSPWLDASLPGTATCYTPPAKAAKKSCCCCCKTVATQERNATEETTPLPRTPVWQSAVCQGVLKFWLSITLAPPACEPCVLAELPGESLSASRGKIAARLASAPPTPPPRRWT